MAVAPVLADRCERLPELEERFVRREHGLVSSADRSPGHVATGDRGRGDLRGADNPSVAGSVVAEHPTQRTVDGCNTGIEQRRR